MKYVYNGAYREFRGYVFTQDKPVEITDRGTLELIKREPDFKEYHHEEERQVPSNTKTAEAVLLEKPKFDRSAWMKKMHAEGRMKK
jgi:hypothetical protein